ncbi:carbamoyltransferase [Streptomyces albidoflavus]
MAYILGMNLSHDRSAAIIKNGEVLVAIEEERLDRIKHTEGFLVQGYFDRLTKTIPMRSVTYCLETVGIGIDDIDLVVGNRPIGDGAAQRIANELPIKDKSKIYQLPMPSHHLAHASVAYHTSPFEDAAVLIVDQAGSRIPGTKHIEKHTVLVGEGTELRSVGATTYSAPKYPVEYDDMGLGLFYDFFTAKLNFITRWGSPDFGVFGCGGYPEGGKTMGLAPYGRPRPEWGDWLTFDGLDITCTPEDLEKIWADLIATEGHDYDPRQDGSWQHQLAKDVAYKVQDELERAMIYLAGQVHELTGKKYLCLGGGVALNSVANQRIRAESPFEDVYIPAPAGDAGCAIGAALWGYHHLIGGKVRTPMLSASLGRTYSRDTTLEALKPYEGMLSWRESTPDEVAGLLAEHHVVGWVVGGSEMGPRALGNRSILADPRHPHTRDFLNEVVKHREVFRPYAPSVLAEHVTDWFDMRGESPFMLLVPAVKEEKRKLVPAITHTDGTARVQTVRQDVNSAYHELISAFHRRTGVPMLLNTSFNDNGEPIVETPADALRTFYRTDMDHLFLNGLLISKPDHVQHDEHPHHAPLAQG